MGKIEEGELEVCGLHRSSQREWRQARLHPEGKEARVGSRATAESQTA